LRSIKNAIFSINIILILIFSGFIGLLIIDDISDIGLYNVRAAQTIIVDDDGTPGVDCNYTIIQYAIDNASVGDTVYVKNGTYYENLIVNKSINLTGEDRINTQINNGHLGDGILVTANWVNITGFLVKNNGNKTNNYEAGINLENVENCKIINNNITNNYQSGIRVSWSNKNFIADNNVISNNKNGILIDGNDNYIFNNTCNSNNAGLYINGGNNNKIKYNTFGFQATGILIHFAANYNFF
jgi:parallel beta-helix repeat protein